MTKPYVFAGVQGPAFLPYDKAVTAINQYIDHDQSPGQGFHRPRRQRRRLARRTRARAGRSPKDRPIEVVLSSKDVIHDFFLPNFRVKLDAVPGMRGHIFFTANDDQQRSRTALPKTYSRSTSSPQALKHKENAGIDHRHLRIRSSPTAELDKATKQWLYRDKDKKTIVRDGRTLIARHRRQTESRRRQTNHRLSPRLLGFGLRRTLRPGPLHHGRQSRHHRQRRIREALRDPENATGVAMAEAK